MNLEFQKVNGNYEVEFAATDAFNLNLVREKEGYLLVFQKGASDGEYPKKPSYRDQKAPAIIDVDITAAAYPKYIKIVSSSPVVKGTVTTDGEAVKIPSNTGGMPTLKPYIKDITWFDMTANSESIQSPDENGWYKVYGYAPSLYGNIIINDPNVIISDIKATGNDINGSEYHMSHFDLTYTHSENTLIAVSSGVRDMGGGSPVMQFKLVEIS